MHKIANMLHIGLEGLITIVLRYLSLLMCWRYELFLCTTWALLSNICINKWLKNGLDVKFFATLDIMWVFLINLEL